MRDTLLRSEEGAMVSYYLGRPENRAITDRIRSLSPQEQVYELGKLEAQLIIAQKTKKQQQHRNRLSRLELPARWTWMKVS